MGNTMQNSTPQFIRIGATLFEKVGGEADTSAQAEKLKKELLERVGAKKKYVERYDRYDKASVAKWLAGIVERSAQEQEDAQDLVDEISDSENPRAGQSFLKLLKDHIANQGHIMKWALDKLENIDEIAPKETPESKADAALTPSA